MNDTTCPLCDFEGEERRVYAHLQTTHRKSELSRAVLDARSDEADTIAAEPAEPGRAD